MKEKSQNMKKAKTNQQAEPAVDREAVRVLAIELGAREAARRVGVKESTVLSWARRYSWQLPKRKGGAISAIKLQSKPGDALIAAHNDLDNVTKTALMQTLAKAAKQVAEKDALDVSNTAQLRDICLAAAKLYGWDGKQGPTVNIHNQVGIVCTEKERQRLIALRAEIGAPLPHAIKQAIPALPPVETQSNANVGAPNANVASNEAPEPCTKPQANAANENPPGSGVPQWHKDIGGAASWKNGKGSEPEDHAGSFGRWPEEYE